MGTLRFTKMHGCGNDYVYINCFEETVEDPAALAVRLSDRHKGIGGDGVILICPSDVADAQMRMFNLDGSEGKMCGNGIRCVAKYVFDHGIARKEELKIETLSGVKTCLIHEENGEAVSVTVDMGEAILSPGEIPVALPERGSGETMACGTGACASAVAAVLCGYCPMGEDILVRLRGGDLTIRYEQDRVWMTGEAVTVFQGTVKI